MSVRAFAPTADDGPELEPGQVLTLDAEESHYLIKVRRLRPGDTLELFDGRGGVWLAKVEASAGAKRTRVRLDRPRPPRDPGPARVVLLGLPDVSATLEALAGASELGASELVMVRCARSQGRVPSRARIERVLGAAMRQCGRPVPLAVDGADGPRSLTAGLAHRAELPGVLAEPTAARELPPSLRAGPCRVFVGPEGGLTADEVEEARAAGFEPLALGPWILRTPTALVALLAALRGGT